MPELDASSRALLRPSSLHMAWVSEEGNAMRRIFLTVTALALLSIQPAGADPMTLFATSLLPGYGNFTVSFNDTGDGKLGFSEVTGFSGVDVTPMGLFPNLIGVPDIPAVSDCGGASSPGCGDWRFQIPGVVTLSAISAVWSYRIAELPEPATLTLVGLGIAGLLLARRRNRRGRLA